MKILTIIVVVKNAEDTLDKTLKSIFCDSNSLDCQVILVDGLSADRTLDIANCYPIEIHSNLDTGIFNAMNIGVQLARCRYVMFINSGDELCGDRTLLKIINELKTQAPDLMYSKIIYFSRIHNYQKIIGGSTSLSDMRFSMPICHQGIIMTKDSLLRLGGFNEKFSAVADYELLIRAFKDDQIKKYFFDCVTTKFWIDDFNWKNSPSAIFQKYYVTKTHFKNYAFIAFIYCCFFSLRYYIAALLNSLPFYQTMRKIKFRLIELCRLDS